MDTLREGVTGAGVSTVFGTELRLLRVEEIAVATAVSLFERRFLLAMLQPSARYYDETYTSLQNAHVEKIDDLFVNQVSGVLERDC